MTAQNERPRRTMGKLHSLKEGLNGGVANTVHG